MFIGLNPCPPDVLFLVDCLGFAIEESFNFFVWDLPKRAGEVSKSRTGLPGDSIGFIAAELA